MAARKLVERVSFRDSDHTYHLNGRRLPSVTGVLDNLSKPGLVYWSAKMGAEAVAERVREFGTIETMIATYADPDALADELYELARYAHNAVKNRAGAKGSLVHAAVDQFHTNVFEVQPPEDMSALTAWNAFVDWWAEAGLTALLIEHKIVDVDGRYAGRFDLLAQDDDGDKYLCDIKTSNSVHMTSAMQNAAYAHALESEGEHTIAGTKVLWLPEGSEKMWIVERNRDEWLRDYAMFYKLLDLHIYRKEMDKFHKEINDAFQAEKAEAQETEDQE